MLTVRDLNVLRGGRELLAGVSFSVNRGELVGVVGPNGVGKSSLLRTLACLEPYAEGEILWQQQALADMHLLERAQLLGFLPQQEVPVWSLAVRHVVELGRSPWRRPLGGLSDEDHVAVARAVAMTEIEPLLDRTVDRLSGGELRRVLLARVLAGQPHCLLADEPITALDPYHQIHVMEILQDHCREGGCGLVAIHDMTLAARFCDRVLLLGSGQLVAQGVPAEVMTRPLLEQVYNVHMSLLETPEGVIIQPSARLS